MYAIKEGAKNINNEIRNLSTFLPVRTFSSGN